MSVQSVNQTSQSYNLVEKAYLQNNPTADTTSSDFETDVMEFAFVNNYQISGLNTSGYLSIGNNNIISQQQDGNLIDFNTQTGSETSEANTIGVTLGHDQVITDEEQYTTDPTYSTEPTTTVGQNMEMTIDGDPHYTLYNNGTQVGEVDDQETGNINEISSNNFGLSVDQEYLNNNNGVTYVTNTNMQLGKTSVSIDPNGNVTMDGSSLSIPDGSSYTTSNGSVITNNGGSYAITTSQYNINITDDGDHQDLDIKTTDAGISSNTTGLVGNCFVNGDQNSMVALEGSNGKIENGDDTTNNIGTQTTTTNDYHYDGFETDTNDYDHTKHNHYWFEQGTSATTGN